MKGTRAGRSGPAQAEFGWSARHAYLRTQVKIAASPREASLGMPDQHTLPRGINVRNTGAALANVSMRNLYKEGLT